MHHQKFDLALFSLQRTPNPVFGFQTSHLLLAGRAGNSASVAPGSFLGCDRGVRRGPLHANSRHPCEDSLEASEEGTAVQGDGRWGGDHSNTAQELEGEEVDQSGFWVRRPSAADAHAGERCAKRARTSAP